MEHRRDDTDREKRRDVGGQLLSVELVGQIASHDQLKRSRRDQTEGVDIDDRFQEQFGSGCVLTHQETDNDEAYHRQDPGTGRHQSGVVIALDETA